MGIASTRRFRKLLVNAVIVPVTLMLVIATLLVWQIERLEGASSLVSHSDQVIAQANELQKLTLDLETGLRGYLLAGEVRFLEPYVRATEVIDRESGELSNAIADNADQQKIVERIVSLRNQWLEYSRMQISRRERNEDVVNPIRVGAGKSLMDEIRVQFKAFIGNEEMLRDTRARAARRVSHVTLVLTGLMALLVGGVLAFLSRAQFLDLSRTYDAALQVANDLNATLEMRVQDRTHELERRSSQLSEANQELEAFGYSISHDLRAPMRHISGFVDLIRKSENHFSPENNELLTTVSTTAKLAGRMVDDLLAFSRVGRTALRMMPVELNPLVEQCRAEIAPDIAGRKVEWAIAPLPNVQGDTALLKMVLQNLISNAIKYTSQKATARIEIGTSTDAEPREKPSAPPVSPMITFFVRDNGVGFDMQYAQKLFGVFQRLHRAEEFEGNGIGLANVRRIILRHGGRVWADSQIGSGATFYFTLPAAVASLT
jgi:signal transduction histidine kinase